MMPLRTVGRKILCKRYSTKSRMSRYQRVWVYPKFCVNSKSQCKIQSGLGRRAGQPVRRPNCHKPEIQRPVKGSGAAAVHIPLTGKGFLLLRHPICVIDRQLGMNDAPILPPSGPFLRNVHHGEIQHFQQTVIRRKNRLGFGDLEAGD